MIVYRQQRQRVATAQVLSRILSASGFERRMELGELEAGVADVLCPEWDADLPVLRALRRGEFGNLDLPREIEISVPEGFAYYALDPELYRRAAARFAREVRPRRVAVIGIRSIGTTLSAVVADELKELGCAVESWTVRPRGDPWNRQLRVVDSLARRWREWDGDFAVVDEGPGLSGSSFACVAEFLASLGIPDQRIVLFPSWCPDGSGFVSESARRRWQLHRKFVTAFEELGRFPDFRDLSGGGWRAVNGVSAAAHPQHERRKYLRDGTLRKFAGYGRYGRAKLVRSQALGRFVPRAAGLEDGYLSMPWIRGQVPRVTTAFLDHVAGYLGFVRANFATSDAPSFDALAEMIAVNAPEAPPVECWRGAVLDGSAAVLDGRMLPHEWIETPEGFYKIDALDHGDDHFFPGPQDIAWDVASFVLEFGLDPQAEARLLEHYMNESRDSGIRERLPFYRLAYLAFRLGYADMAASSLRDSEDGPRFQRERARYAGLLRQEARSIGHAG
ncbi:MAG TPA: hypothetical protein VJ732_02945 [Bryobacteraceae bacterium]|nr:hypothetical protein [Bryobacteraceae bacterium]